MFDCEICDKQFTSKNAMVLHFKSFHGPDKNKYKCDECDSIFSRKDHLKNHKMGKHSLSDFACELCKISFIHKSSMERHFKDFHGPNKVHRKTFKCDKCNSIFVRKQNLNSHRILMHLSAALESFTEKRPQDQEDKAFQNGETTENMCDSCDTVFSDREKLNIHKKLKHPPLTCGLCGKSFTLKRSWVKHVNIVHGRDKKRYKRGGSKLIKDKLDSNKSTKHSPVVKIKKKRKTEYMCNFCDRVFQDREKLDVHKKVKHKFTCEPCERSYLCKSSWVKHVNTLHGADKDRYNCDGSELMKDKLDSNKSTTLSSAACETEFVCDLCCRVFLDRKKLHIHKKAVHKRFNCKVCEKSYTRKYDLIRHTNYSHGADKNKYKCELCEKSYSRRDCLNAHNKMKHQTIAFELDEEPLANHVDPLAEDSLHEDQLSTDIKIENEVLQETYLSGFGSSKGVPGNNFSAIGNESRISRCVEEAFDCMRQLIGKKAMQDQYSLYGDHIGNQIRSSGRNDKEIYIAKQLINDVIEQLSLDNSLFKS